MIYIGIDPGVSGGIAMLWPHGPTAVKMPDTEQDLLRLLQIGEPSVAVLERVHASPQMGCVSAFTFGAGYGRLRMALVSAAIPFDEVTPGKWQGVMGLRQKTGRTVLGEHKKDKNIAKRRAQELFPSLTVTHAISDALLIASYCERLHTGVIARDAAR